MKQSHKVRKKIIEITQKEYGYQKAFSYLRKINPFVFEELILSSIENKNIRVYRNTRYTGDGGSDGEFKTKKGTVLVQCKRYGSHINNKHIIDLADLVERRRAFAGLFVHTGKTGARSKVVLRQHRNIILLSGEKLIDAIIGKSTMVSSFKAKKNYQNKKEKTSKEVATNFPF